MRRILLVIAAMAVLGAAALVALPWWLGFALRRAGPGHGLTFGRYERAGYGRFALDHVDYRRPGLHITAARVEAPTPLAWVLGRFEGGVGRVVVTNWRAEVASAPGPKPAKPSGTPTGWTSTREQVGAVIDTLSTWLPQARFGRGTITWPGGNATLASLGWQDRRLTLQEVGYAGERLNVVLTAPADSDALTADIAALDRPVEVTLESRAATLSGNVRLAGNRAPFEIQFPAAGWLPRSATLHAAHWSVPGDAVGLGRYYRTVQAEAQLDWHSGAFSVDTQLHGQAAAAAPHVPALAVDLRAHGNATTITLQALRVDAPGLSAQLSDPVVFDHRGRLQGPGAVFMVDADLAQVPGSKITGAARGRAEIASGLNAAPAVAFELAFDGVRAAGVAIGHATAQGQFRSPAIRVEHGTLTGTSGETLHWHGTWNFDTKQVADAAIEGDLRRATLARWLPAALQFESVHLQAGAAGPVAALNSHGSLHAANVVLPDLRPASVDLTWTGEGTTLKSVRAKVELAHTELTAEGSVTPARLDLRQLELAQPDGRRLTLEHPVEVTWKPRLSLHDLRLAGPGASLGLSADWGAEGKVELAAANLDSAWAADVLQKPVRAFALQSLAVVGSWYDGPAAFSIGMAATGPLPSGQVAQLNVAARGDEHGVRIDALRVSAGNATVATASGRLPLTVTPGAQPRVHLDEKGAIAVQMHTAPHAEFWRQLEATTGVALEQPSVQLDLSGNWNRPKGTAVLRAGGIRLDPGRFHRDLPALAGVNIQVSADDAGIELDRFLVDVAGQVVSASGHLPFPEGGWQGLARAPLDALRTGADVRVQVAHAEIGAFRPFVAKVLAPTGTVTVDASYRHGDLHGRLQLHGAATQPLGPLGIVRDINADIALDGRKLTVQSADAQSGGHPIKLGGTIEIPVHAPPRFDLSVNASNVPFVRETGLLVRGDLDLKLRTGADQGTDLTGTVRLRDSIFMRDFQSLAPHGGGGGSGAAPPYFSVNGAPMNAWRLNVKVIGDRFLRIETPVFAGVASMQFQLLGTLGAPRAIGAVRLDRGQVVMPFATFAVQQGTVTLTEADPVQPKLDITAATRKYGYDLKLSVTGTADAPSVEFSSSPPLPSDQILLLVMAGVAPNNEIATTNRTRAVQLGAYLGKGLLGIGAGGENRLRIESGADVSEQGKQTYSISYDLTPRWTAIGEYTRFDEYVADATWQLWPKPKDTEPRPPKRPKDAARIDVQGVGLIRGRKLRSALERVLGPPTTTLDTNAIEDAAVMLLSAVKDDGYQDARLDLKVTGADGTERTLAFDPSFATPLPTSLRATKVQFDVARGTRWHVTSATITGVTAIPPEKAQAYFHSDDALFNASVNAYSPSRLASAAGALRTDLQRLGYADAKVTARVARVANGAVDVAVEVDQGPKWTVDRIEFSRDASAGVTFPDVKPWLGQPLAPSLKQDIRNSVRQAYYRGGYPDTEVTLVAEPVHRDAARVATNVRVIIEARPRVTVGHVRFEGNAHTKESVLRSRVEVHPGEPLDVLALEQARFHLARLGLFDDVQLHYDPATGPVRDPVFTVDEAPRFKTNLLIGYGSYEQLRAGFETRQKGLFGYANESRLRFVQSMKSTDFDFTYTIPELLGENIDGTAEVYALRRREIAFLRKEFGASVGLQRQLPNTGGLISLRYGLGALANSRNALVTRVTDKTQVNVGSLTLSVTGDRRDHPLDPRRGYNWLARLEVASPNLGGVATFQRLELSAGYHTPWGHGRWIHLGFSQGVVTTLNGDDSSLPVNRRFYPGGANSIRGYQNGEAAPRDAEGRFLGAKSFLLLNLELEQAITPSLSAVAFTDALGESAYLRDAPWRNRLYSVGVGLRYRTVVGPIRVEYGRNVHPRPHDPSGTLQISIGYPF